MLSPNATKRVTDNRGGPVTVTLNVQVAVCCRASTARQVIGVDPRGNSAPLDGEHVIVNGDVPPVAVGDEKVTITGRPLADATVDGAGQASAIDTGDGGPVGQCGLIETAMA